MRASTCYSQSFTFRMISLTRTPLQNIIASLSPTFASSLLPSANCLFSLGLDCVCRVLLEPFCFHQPFFGLFWGWVQDRILRLVEAGVDILVIDERNGDTTEQIEQVTLLSCTKRATHELLLKKQYDFVNTMIQLPPDEHHMLQPAIARDWSLYGLHPHGSTFFSQLD